MARQSGSKSSKFGRKSVPRRSVACTDRRSGQFRKQRAVLFPKPLPSAAKPQKSKEGELKFPAILLKGV
jgi:hypothetical protein